MAGGTRDDRRAQSRAHEEQDELVRRLRALSWPAPPPDVRDRCLADFERRLAELEEHGEAPSTYD